MNDFIKQIYSGDIEAIVVKSKNLAIFKDDTMIVITSNIAERLNSLTEKCLIEFFMEDPEKYIAIENSDIKVTFIFELHSVKIESKNSEDVIELNYFILLKILYQYLKWKTHDKLNT